ncbi:SURF1 family protein [Streptomyces oceani]|uniref:SURF1 family cytochrome oxidase biogenesis protein n=1 Tax=Streptomyces oceani TaxID=1075402 RepID=UPI0009A0FDCB|nr:SURF1 family protein [Streptomyces oceani]
MYRFLLSRQWVMLTLLALALIPTMVELGFWQLHRHESRVAHNELIAESLSAPTVPVTELTSTRRGPDADVRFRTVRAKGTYDTEHEVVVRQRTAADEQSIGYFVLTPLIREDGTAVLVNRGWIKAGRDLTEFPKVPKAPEGPVTVTGRLMADETTSTSGIKDKEGLPARQVMLINSEQQAERLDRPVLGGYVQLTRSIPEPTGERPERIAEPDHDSIGPHMAYAVQWWLFAAAVPVGWVVLVRRERRDRISAAAGQGGPGGARGPAAPKHDTAAGRASPADDTADVPDTDQATGALATDTPAGSAGRPGS